MNVTRSATTSSLFRLCPFWSSQVRYCKRAFDQGHAALAEILPCKFRLASEGGHVDETDLLPLLLALPIAPVDRQAEGGDR